MKNRANRELTALAASLGAALLFSHARSDGVYSVTPQTLDGGGGRSTSANYTSDGSIGGIVGSVSTAPPDGMVRHGYVGQLTDPVGFALAATPQTIDEESTRQIHAATLNDDDTRTLLAGTDVDWSVVDGPITNINATGLAMAGAVYENTPATVRGQWADADETLVLSVLNTHPDNYGMYAADGIDDDWQITNYGLENPNAAPGYNPFGTGDNLFKFFADLNPTDPNARFHLAIRSVPGEPDHKDLVFSPLAAGRIYTVLSRTDLTAGEWNVLESASDPVINGDQATITDLEVFEPAKFYRVRITWPR